MVEVTFGQHYPAAKRIAAVHAARMVTRHRLPREDRHDLQQDALFEFWQKRHLFDAGRGTPGAFAEIVIGNRLASVMRSLRADLRGYGKNESLDELAHTLPAPDHCIDLRIAIREVLTGVSAFDRTVALFLIDNTPTEASRCLRASRSKVNRAIIRLRKAFTSAGLRAKPLRCRNIARNQLRHIDEPPSRLAERHTTATLTSSQLFANKGTTCGD